MIEKGKGFAPDRGGNSARRGDQPVAAERRAARAGGGRRGPLPQHRRRAGDAVAGTPVLVRYADDLLALCHSRRAGRAGQGTAGRHGWQPRGLGLQRGQDTHRRPRARDSTSWGSTSAATQRQAADQTELRRLSDGSGNGLRPRCAHCAAPTRWRSSPALNPIIRGWAAYYRAAVSSEVFNALDAYVWRLTYRWALRGAPRTSRRQWIVGHYFGVFHPTRNDRWVFGDRRQRRLPGQVRLDTDRPAPAGQGPALTRTTPPWPTTGPGGASKSEPPLGRTTLRLLQTQDGRCPLCGDYLLHADHQPASPTRVGAVAEGHPQSDRKTGDHNTGGSPPNDHHHRLVHTYCQRDQNDIRGNSPDRFNPSACPRGLLEPCAATSRMHGS